MRDRYRSLFSDRVFVGAILLGGMNFTGLFAYLTTSSFLFQDVFGFSAQQFGLLFAVNSIGVVVGVQISSRLMRNGIGPQWILAVTTIAQLAMAITILVLADQHAGILGDRDSALVLHRRVRILVPGDPGARIGEPRGRSRNCGLPARGGELRPRRIWLRR